MSDNEQQSHLSLLIGKELEGVLFVRDYITLLFGELSLSALSVPIITIHNDTICSTSSVYKDHLVGLIGQHIKNVSESKYKLEIVFDGQSRLIIPLDADFPVGPEMAILSGQDFFAEWSRP